MLRTEAPPPWSGGGGKYAMQEVLEAEMGPNDHYRGVVLTTGSAGTIGCGDYMKELFPASKVAASEDNRKFDQDDNIYARARYSF